VGETNAGPSDGSETTTAAFPRSPAYHCSLWATTVPWGPAVTKLEQCSTRTAGSRMGSSSSKAFTANTSQGSTPAPAASPSTSPTRSGRAASAAARNGPSTVGRSAGSMPRRSMNRR
jgi:hypothetical protein